MAAARSLVVAAAAAAALAGRYVAGRDRAAKQTVRELDIRLANLGEVERLTILPWSSATPWEALFAASPESRT